MSLLRTTVDMVVGHFPLPGEDDVILLDGILDHVGCRQYLLLMFLGVSLDTMDLCHMGSPFYLGIIHL